MKSMAFIRKAWGRKDKNKISKRTKEDLFVYPPSPEWSPDMCDDTPSPAAFMAGFGAPAVMAGSVQKNMADDHYVSRFQSSDETIPTIRKPLHDSLSNAAHDPSYLHLNTPLSPLRYKSSAGGSMPARPATRPPPLYSHSTATKQPINTDLNSSIRSQDRATFTQLPNRHSENTIACEGTVPSFAIYNSPGSSDEPDDASSYSTEGIPCCSQSIILPDRDRVHSRRPADTDNASPRSPEKADCLSPSRAALYSSDSPEPRRFYDASLRRSSTPHLSTHRKEQPPSLTPLRLGTNYEYAEDDSLANPLSLFPVPPATPLFVRRKIQSALALRPATATISPSPSSLTFAESNHNLSARPKTSPAPITPKTPRRPSTSPGILKSYSPPFSSKSPSRTVPPQLFEPPTSPLPTPPTSPRKDVQRSLASHSFHAVPSPSHKPLRVVKSTNQLRPEIHVVPLQVHRLTTSEPLPPDMTESSISQSKRRVRSRLELQQSNAYYLEDQRVNSYSKVQVGYAV